MLAKDRVSDNLWVYKHALIKKKIDLMRDESCSASRFRALTREISTYLTYQASSDLSINYSDEGPAGEYDVPQAGAVKLAVVPILRAGLVVAEGALEAVPSAHVGHLGLERNEDYSAKVYLAILPSPLDRIFFVCDVALGTGNTACAAVSALKEHAHVREDHIRFLTLLVAHEGAQKMATEHPGVSIHAASLEKGLNAKHHIVPGFGGDASDRLFGIW